MLVQISKLDKVKIISVLVFTIVVIGALISIIQLVEIHNSSFTDQPIGLLHFSQYSQNWAGYVLTPTEFGFNKEVWMINGTFTVPTIYHTSLADVEMIAVWLGIDGYQNNNLIQTGVECDEADGTSVCYPWYELIPANQTIITSFSVNPGDKMFAQITLINSTTDLWNIYLKDLSNGQYFSTNVYYQTPMTSAEWVVEAPYSNGVLSLPSFSTVQFNDAHLYVHGFIFGQNYSLGQINPHILFINQSSTNAATPSAVFPDGTSFTVTYSGIPQAPVKTFLKIISYTSTAYLGNTANISAQIYVNHSITLNGGEVYILTPGLLQGITLDLYSDGTLVSQATTNQTGVAKFDYNVNLLGVGTHSLYVSYAGNKTYQQSTSQIVSITVMRPSIQTSQQNTTISNSYSNTTPQ